MAVRITFVKSVPKSVYLAFSGGVDSVVLLHRLLSKKIDVTLLWINHRTEWCKTEEEFLVKTASKYNLPYSIRILPEYDNSTSKESFWSRRRNDIYQALDKPVVTGHHLDDAVEWYVMSAMQGLPKALAYRNNNVIRPMLLTTKQTIVDYVSKYELEHLTDPTNDDVTFNLRNKVRKETLPVVLECFPGLRKTVAKLILKKEAEDKNI